MKQVILSVIITFFATSIFAQQPDNNTAAFPKSEASVHTKLSYKIIDTENKTYGYDIYADDRLMIHQTSIPALPGNDGFKTKKNAEKIAELVIEKIKKGQMPPTVTVEELKKLKVIK